ncbi:MAG TPA: hypothetical protein VIM37_01530 [Candidatus Microsaccharimonas sp.]
MSKYESLPYDSSRPSDPKFERNSQKINELLLPIDETETAETTRDRIIKGFRIGDPSMPFTHEIAEALRRANWSIGLSPARPRQSQSEPSTTATVE